MGNELFKRERTPLWIVGYSVYLYFSGHSLRTVSRDLFLFVDRSHQAVWEWVHRYGALADAFHRGMAKTAVVDERSVNVRGLEAWLWMALEPRSRRMLALEVSWTRNNLVAYGFLKRLRDRYGVRVVVCNGASWYGVCRELGLRRIADPDLQNLVERLSKEVKRRLKDFDLYFPCRCPTPLRHVGRWLEAYRGFHNYARYHMALGKAPSSSLEEGPLTILTPLKEVVGLR